MKIVEVLWGDAWVKTGDISLKKCAKLGAVMRTTIGYLAAETDEGVVLVTDKYEDDQDTVNTPMFIPWGWIKGYWEISTGVK